MNMTPTHKAPLSPEQLPLSPPRKTDDVAEEAEAEAPMNDESPSQPKPMQIKIGASEVSVTAEQEAIDLDKAVNAAPFREWVRTIEKDPRMVVESIVVESVDMFGPRVGFMKFKADVKVDGKTVPG